MTFKILEKDFRLFRYERIHFGKYKKWDNEIGDGLWKKRDRNIENMTQKQERN